MKILTRFKNWILGIAPEVLDLLRPVMLELTPQIVAIIKAQVKASELAFSGGGSGNQKFALAQSQVRGEIKKLGLTLSDYALRSAIEAAVKGLNK